MRITKEIDMIEPIKEPDIKSLKIAGYDELMEWLEYARLVSDDSKDVSRYLRMNHTRLEIEKEENDIRETVFRYLFDNNGSYIHSPNPPELYFLSFGNVGNEEDENEEKAIDPDDEFIKRFAKNKHCLANYYSLLSSLFVPFPIHCYYIKIILNDKSGYYLIRQSIGGFPVANRELL